MLLLAWCELVTLQAAAGVRDKTLGVAPKHRPQQCVVEVSQLGGAGCRDL
jgi:hypothetical protein